MRAFMCVYVRVCIYICMKRKDGENGVAQFLRVLSGKMSTL